MALVLIKSNSIKVIRMFKPKDIVVLSLVIILFSSCGAVKTLPKTAFVDGFYKQRKDNKKKKVYVQIEEMQILVHPVQNKNNNTIVDTLQKAELFQR